MSVHREIITLRAPGRGLHEITAGVTQIVRRSAVEDGLCNVFVQHTSASLTINENADPTARRDLEAFLDRLVPPDEPYFRHTMEGPDDMPSHIKCALTDVSLTMPVAGGDLALGTWQGIYLWEHRDGTPSRRIVVSVF